MALEIKKARKYAHRLKIGLGGPTGAGKTYTMLRLLTEIAKRESGRVGVIDSEHGTASLYAEEFDFDVIELESFAPDRYIEAIDAFERSPEHVCIGVDSLSHAWIGKDGELEQVDLLAKASRDNSFVAWRTVTPQHNRLVEKLVSCQKHLIVTLRSKMAYEMQENAQGKKAPVKLGMAPMMRDGIEYEFDVYAEIDVGHTLEITKTRCKAVDGHRVKEAGESLAAKLWEWAQGDAAPVHEASQERPGVVNAAPAAASPAPSPAFDQLGVFAKPDGSINMLAFGAELRRRELSPKDLHGIVEPNAAGDGLDIRRWLRENPTRTLLRLTEMGQCNRYGHEEPVFTEDPDDGMVCPRCKLPQEAKDEPPPEPEEHEEAHDAAGEAMALASAQAGFPV